ncbi:MAG: Sensory box protein [Acetothermia bacterium 64_32]|nr:MAG: Sensory box protein [Acetothermia bacterium 64_32]HAF71228.1 DUF438 domain-containing protein [Candidatus Acetothermia bacterium]
MGELTNEDRKRALKGILRRLHAGESPDALKGEFRRAVGDVTPVEIAQIEQELVREGISREEIAKLCDVHLALFRESLEEVEPLAPPWHPIHILMEEHRRMLGFAKRLRKAAERLAGSPGDAGLLAEIEDLMKHLEEAESHYLREENVLFPALERHGIAEPPQVMWMEHDHIRSLKKELRRLHAAREQGYEPRLAEFALALSDTLVRHFHKEGKILFPTALGVIPEAEWPALRAEFDEIGYCCFTPPPPPAPEGEPPSQPRPVEGMVELPTGSFTVKELAAVLDALPVDITFVDAEDRVRYFNQSKDRIFVRSKSVIGRTVQNCHPQKSVHVVNRILEDFRAGRRDVAEFWINLKGRLVYIRYFPVWSPEGEYLGVIEVTQDVTGVRELKGERRLLDEPAVKG